MSGHGIPPPPPPRRFPNAASSSSSAGRKNDVGSLCPPPLQAQASPFHIAGSQQQPMHHPLNPASYQMYQQYPGYSYGNVQYQQVQQPVHSGYQYTHQNQHYYAYPNYASAPPPPPPPPRNPPTSNNNINIDNIAIPSSTKSDSPSPHRATQGDKPKKLNPKMAQKYSGQGLKTITISGPGLRPQKFKICVGNHPDDIKKWIEERKKNFPRTSCRQKGVNNRSGDVKQHQTETKRNRGGDVDTNESDDPTKQHNESGENAASLSNLLAGYGSSSSTSDDESTSKKDKSFDLAGVETTAAAKATSEKVSEDTNTSIQSRPKRICKYFQRGKCHHGDSCKFLHSNEASSATRSDQRKRKRQAQSDRDKARNDHEHELQILGLANPSHGSNLGGKTVTNTSLLHKLLQRDKERERRLTLQLLRYIVDCDYFQSEKSIDVQA